MKTVLCYGDSNTFGFNPIDGSRYDENIRWSGILKELLKDKYEIIEEGMNNRTAIANNSDGFLFCANRHFPKLLSKIKYVDILIFALGTNDLQFQYDLSLHKIVKGIENLISDIGKKAGKIILVPPVILDENILKGNFKIQFDESSISKSRKLKDLYKKISIYYNTYFLDFNEFTKPSAIDGLHYSKDSHKLIAEKLAEYIEKIS